MRRGSAGKDRFGRPWRTAAVAVAAVMSLCPAAQAQRVVPLTADMELEAAPAPVAETLLLSIGKAQLVSLAEPVRDVVIANPAIADVIVKTASQVYLVAQEIGETNVFFVNEDGEVVRHIVVRVEIDLVAAREALGALLPDSAITLRSVNGNIVMSGAVRASKEALDAADLVARFAGEGDEGAERVVNMLRVTEDQQVLLQIRVAEMQRSVLKTLGFDTPISRGDLDFDFAGLAGAGEAIAAGSILFGSNDLGLSTISFNTLESQGLAKTLAEPVLTAISGETANFVAGGEFPVPTQASQGVVAFTFREFGVVSSFTPVVLSANEISLRVAVEVSAISDFIDATDNSPQIPIFDTRRAETTVTLPSGGSVMIAGLMRADILTDIDGAPWLMNVPILGALFRSHRFQRDETELVMTITPYRVGSADNRRPLGLPTDGFVPSSDMDLFLFGHLVKQYSSTDRLNALPAVYGPIGYVME